MNSETIVYELRPAWDHRAPYCGHCHATIREAVDCPVGKAGAYDVIEIGPEGDRALSSSEVDDAI